MLVEFRAENFRSIKDRIVFSMVASNDKSLEDSNVIATNVESIPKLVVSAGIYGANASGKSNFLKAISYMQAVLRESLNAPTDATFNVQPFLMDKSFEKKPSEFEITYLDGKVRYQYGFAINRERIVEEWLYVYKTAKPQCWFTRTYNTESGVDEYYFGPNLLGQKEIWKESTRRNVLFLSIAAKLNSVQLKPIYEWVINKLVIFGLDTNYSSDATIAKIGNTSEKSEVLKFLSSADFGIKDVEIDVRKVLKQNINFNLEKRISQSTFEDSEASFPVFVHETENGTGKIEFNEESLGTQRFFALTGSIIEIIRGGKILVFDELDASLHTLLARKIIELFHDPVINCNFSQLIFSTHDTNLLSNNLLRRDQIWLVEKDKYQASKLYSINDFSPRKQENFEIGYLTGRYGAVPFFRSDSLEMETDHGER